jgi:hypothetical protein
MFFSPYLSRRLLQPTDPNVNWYQVFFPGIKRSGRDVDHPRQSSTGVKERVELYLCSPFFALMACYGVSLTFTFKLYSILSDIKTNINGWWKWIFKEIHFLCVVWRQLWFPWIIWRYTPTNTKFEPIYRRYCGIWGCQSCVNEVQHLTGYDAVWFGRFIRIFGRTCFLRLVSCIWR